MLVFLCQGKGTLKFMNNKAHNACVCFSHVQTSPFFLLTQRSTFFQRIGEENELLVCVITEQTRVKWSL
jgi:hypothetical protein